LEKIFRSHQHCKQFVCVTFFFLCSPLFANYDCNLILKHLLVYLSDSDEELWMWKFDNNELFMEVGEEIRFRVIDVYYKSKQETNVMNLSSSSSSADKSSSLSSLSSSNTAQSTISSST